MASTCFRVYLLSAGGITRYSRRDPQISPLVLLLQASRSMPQSATGLPFDDIRNLLPAMPEADASAVEAVRLRDSELTKPPGASAGMEEIVEWLAAWQGSARPAVNRPAGLRLRRAITASSPSGVSPYPQSVTQQMLENFPAGGAAINQICATYDLGFKVFDLALDLPTGDITAGAGDGREGLRRHDGLRHGGDRRRNRPARPRRNGHRQHDHRRGHLRRAVWRRRQPIGSGAAPGVDDAGMARKVAAVETALATHAGHLDDPLEVLRRLGGREIAAMAGAILAARLQRVPVVLDGYVVDRGGRHAARARSRRRSTIASPGMSRPKARIAKCCERLGKKPLLDLGMRLGEGTGAALAMGLIKAAAACHRDMATFSHGRRIEPLIRRHAGEWPLHPAAFGTRPLDGRSRRHGRGCQPVYERAAPREPDRPGLRDRR